MLSYTDRVANGVRALDTHDPNWFYKINLDKLDQFDFGKCVLGQYVGVDNSEEEALSEEDRDKFFNLFYMLGFNKTDNDGGFYFFSNADEECDELTPLWKQVILNKRNKEKISLDEFVKVFSALVPNWLQLVDLNKLNMGTPELTRQWMNKIFDLRLEQFNNF